MGESSLIKISIQTRKDQTTEGKEHASIRQPCSGLSQGARHNILDFSPQRESESVRLTWGGARWSGTFSRRF